MRKIASSKQVIDYLMKNLDKKDYVSFFVAGSIPDKLVPQSDFDIFFVIKGKRKDNFFDRLVKIMDRFVKNHKGVGYSLFRGSLKYERKGLIHFIIYTEEDHDNFGHREQFKHELNQFVKGLMKSAKIIRGKQIKGIYSARSLKDPKKTSDDIDYVRKKYKILKDKGYIQYRQWKKTKKGWKFLSVRKYPRSFFKNYLLNYFKKNLKNKK